MASLKVGDLAPAFALPAAGGTTISLSDFRGKKVILYFYPKDDTSGCTKEACAFRDTISILKKKGVVIIGASIDSVASHEKFTEKYKLPFPLISDEEKDLVKKYGVWKEKSMYGRKYMGIERTTFLIDEKGRIAHIFPKVKVDGHVDEILSVL
jgi:peroxiredoxin Q/BCP